MEACTRGRYPYRSRLAETMTTNQFRAALSRLGLSQRGASRIFGVNERTVRRWALGEVSVPIRIVETLKNLIAAHKR